MKKRFRILSISIVLLALIFSVSFSFFQDKRDWNFIQMVGGIKIDSPLETEDGFYLPVICNVSGLDSVTIKPKTLNSALSCIKIKSKIDENTIHIIVVTGIAVSENDDCNCKAIPLGFLKSGNYIVYYGEKTSFEHQIGKFTIE
jgi:hypothetical protein